MRRCFATATNAAQIGVRASPAALADIVDSRRAVFGDVPGNGRRSGRKWLRGALRGSAVKAWYGVQFTDVLPNFITAEKEEVFNNEQQLNRVGKSRITGKMKPFNKPLVDTMLFEEGLEEIMADLDFEDSDALLTEEELQRRDALLAGAEDEETMDGIRELFERIAAEREEQREAWEAKLGVTAGEEGDAGASGSKGKRKPEPNLRQGWDDKRSSGDPAPAPAAAPASEAAAGEAAAAAAAAAPAGGEEGGAAAEPEKGGAGADPLAAMAAATVFNVDPSKLTPEQFDAAYAAHCKERAKVEWAALQEIKEDSVLGSLWRDAEAVLKQEALPVSEEGLEKLYLAERAEQEARAQSIFDSGLKRAAEGPARRSSSSSSSSGSSASPGFSGGRGGDRRGGSSSASGWGGSDRRGGGGGGSGDRRSGGGGGFSRREGGGGGGGGGGGRR